MIEVQKMKNEATRRLLVNALAAKVRAKNPGMSVRDSSAVAKKHLGVEGVVESAVRFSPCLL